MRHIPYQQKNPTPKQGISGTNAKIEEGEPFHHHQDML